MAMLLWLIESFFFFLNAYFISLTFSLFFIYLSLYLNLLSLLPSFQHNPNRWFFQERQAAIARGEPDPELKRKRRKPNKLAEAGDSPAKKDDATVAATTTPKTDAKQQRKKRKKDKVSKNPSVNLCGSFHGKPSTFWKS